MQDSKTELRQRATRFHLRHAGSNHACFCGRCSQVIDDLVKFVEAGRGGFGSYQKAMAEIIDQMEPASERVQ